MIKPTKQEYIKTETYNINKDYRIKIEENAQTGTYNIYIQNAKYIYLKYVQTVNNEITKEDLMQIIEDRIINWIIEYEEDMKEIR